MGKLTALKVSKRLAPGRYGDGGGLYLLVSEAGTKSWMLRVVVNDAILGTKRRDLGLGSAELVTLEEAREKARELRKVAREGGDPKAARDKRGVVVPTFQQAAESCHGSLASGWADRHAAAFLSTLRLHVFPKIPRYAGEADERYDNGEDCPPHWQHSARLPVQLSHLGCGKDAFDTRGRG